MQCATAVFSAYYVVGFHLWSTTPANFSRLKLPFEPRTVLFQQTITYATDVLSAENASEDVKNTDDTENKDTSELS